MWCLTRRNEREIKKSPNSRKICQFSVLPVLWPFMSYADELLEPLTLLFSSNILFVGSANPVIREAADSICKCWWIRWLLDVDGWFKSKFCDALDVSKFDDNDEEEDDEDVPGLEFKLWSSNTDDFLDLFRGGWSSKSSEDLVEVTLPLQ